MAALVSPHRAKRWATTTTLYGLVAMVAMWAVRLAVHHQHQQSA
jgi:hypothetical protein